MFKQVLVPLDGSRFAELAVPVAAELARRTGGQVRLLLVQDSSRAAVPTPAGPVETEYVDAALREHQRSYLESFAKSVGRGVAPLIASDVIDGRPGPALSEAMESWDADLMVMTTHGRGPISRFWVGSTADYVVRHATRPVLLLRPGDESDWPRPDLDIRVILVAVDFSSESEAILKPAVDLAKVYQARIELAHVLVPRLGAGPAILPYPVPQTPAIDELSQAAAEEMLHAIAGRVREQNVEVTTRLLFGSSVAGALLDLLGRDSGRVAAIATHGFGGVRRALLGSVADKVIRGSARPVLVVRPRP
jgi:nucleotide-binding universal stress UspA family protein